ncbi:phytanoyl-CoA dioxygenase family protein [Acaryochloris marina]|uniref:Phytanoyl-CoA dioxygenase family protein n=1 Tax=Acaryochloris marina (strain MBIC 11017) TaxID=329726 RepID=B0C9Y0_ACAM1|nr:phytanoyl-CoA dioxygenase family protein [Acaryochloris marina]ABW25420.1 hypothetical protein AM1_0361 [Acaryochloris marina MBIC11017]
MELAIPPTTPSMSLQQTFRQQGYVVIKNFFSPQEMATLIEQIESPQSRQCLDQCLTKGTLRFYANLYRHNESIQKFVSQPKIVNFLYPFIGSDFWVRWDQAVAKGPGAKTFPWHQDNAYNGFKQTHYQLWVALTSMTIENGGLWLVPGSHHQLLPHRKINDHMVYQGEPESPTFITAEVGDIVLFSSLTLHKTTPNTTEGIRWAYVIEYMSTNDYDPGIAPPFLKVAKQGQPQAEFVQSYRGRNPINRLKHRLSRREISQILEWQ